MIDLAEIRRRHPLPEVARGIVQLRASGNEWVACCPFHADKTPSFTIYRSDGGGWRAHCFGCGWHGDVLDLVQRAYGVALPEAARMLQSGDGLQWLNDGGSDKSRLARPTDALALATWRRTVPSAETPAESYLRGRGLQPPYPPDLRFAVLACDDLGPTPCLVCAVRDVSGAVTGIQRIWLAPDGNGKAAVACPKRSLGRVKGGAIRLTFATDFDNGAVTVCEGPEDGLSLLHMLGGPVWVAAGAGFLPAMLFPPEVRQVVIGADNDPAGIAAARTAAHAFVSRGLSVRILSPAQGCKDFNDEIRRAGT